MKSSKGEKDYVDIGGHIATRFHPKEMESERCCKKLKFYLIGPWKGAGKMAVGVKKGLIKEDHRNQH